MRLDRLELELRRRTPWEALDLGMGMVRRWAWPVYRVWFVFVLPPAILLLFLLQDYAWGGLAVWWLKPVADRLLLKVFAEASFGAPPTVKQVWQSLPELLRHSGLFSALTWRRLSSYRSFVLPMLQLEGQRGAAFRKRRQVLGRKTQGYATWLMQFCVCCIVIFELGLLILAHWLMPGDLRDVFAQFSLFGKGGELSHAWNLFFMMAWLTAETLVEPFYVAAGFSLYLNRRGDLEGWDIEVAFRRMQTERTQVAHPSGMKGKRAFSVIPALWLILLIGFAAQPFGANAKDEDDKPPPEKIIRVEGEARRQALAVLADPDFGSVEETTEWRWRNRNEAHAEDKKTEERNFLDTWGARVREGLEKFFGGLAEVVRFVLYGLMILALAACVVFLYRNLDRFWSEAPLQKGVRPETLFGLDLRPETLPDDIAAAALAEAEAGHWIAALSLLYRGALVTLIERDRVVFRAGDTEDLCLARVHRHIEGDALATFADLLAEWKAAAYAGRLPTLVRVRALCADWRAHFAAPLTATGREGA
ncbi:MAG: hypothetical protein LBR88_08670 [Zoogloeaceae bacterium]|jgi:hypothetical protein|nr:hypothetical protein [Zoogloeaceae bacterium]